MRLFLLSPKGFVELITSQTQGILYPHDQERVCLAVGKASTVAPTNQTRHTDDAGSAAGATDATLWLCLTLLYSL